MMTIESFLPKEKESIGVFAGASVFLDTDGDPVIDVRGRTGLWVRPDTLRELADDLEEVLG